MQAECPRAGATREVGEVDAVGCHSPLLELPSGSFLPYAVIDAASTPRSGSPTMPAPRAAPSASSTTRKDPVLRWWT
ncbi:MULTISPECIES: hypothetical protein [Mycolicibacterium]|uniref:hypothetical protein n=1 Tax=Mycolicibacterium TaxID=1866885 RepID=UPI00022E2CF6|nr:MULTISPECIES: hypothetical protein [Mycolicibacterium]